MNEFKIDFREARDRRESLAVQPDEKGGRIGVFGEERGMRWRTREKWQHPSYKMSRT